MARSLEVQREEQVTTSPLLWGFLVIAAGLLLGGAVLGGWSEDASAASMQTSTTLQP